jgi:nucleoside-diphosphate-sugar epimerase
MIVVTGGAGFIGSRLVRRLNELGQSNILIVDHLGSSEKWRNLTGLSFSDYIHKDAFIRLLEAGGERVRHPVSFDRVVTRWPALNTTGVERCVGCHLAVKRKRSTENDGSGFDDHHVE